MSSATFSGVAKACSLSGFAMEDSFGFCPPEDNATLTAVTFTDKFEFMVNNQILKNYEISNVKTDV